MTKPGPPQIFSRSRRQARAQRHERAAARSADVVGAQFLRAEACQDILERLDFMNRTGGRAIVQGDASGLLAGGLGERGFAVAHPASGALDEERPWRDPGFDLIVSLFALDTVNDLPGALIHIRKALNTGGLFIGCFTGAGSLPMLRKVLLAADGDRPAARLHPMIDPEAATGLMQRAGFARQVVDSIALRASYGQFGRVVEDLRAQGLTNVLADAPPPLTRTGLVRARTAFKEMSGEDGRLIESFEILTLTGWQ